MLINNGRERFWREQHDFFDMQIIVRDTGINPAKYWLHHYAQETFTSNILLHLAAQTHLDFYTNKK